MTDSSEGSLPSKTVLEVDESSAFSTPTKQQGEAQQARKNFTAGDDLILLRAANTVKPWEAPYGTANGVMKCFDQIARMCSDTPTFVKEKPGTSLRTRFDKLVKQFREAERASRRASGTSEEYEERDVLLQDIVQRMDGWKSLREEEKQYERAKRDGIEASGALMRRLAMGELEDELHADSQSGDEDVDPDRVFPATEASSPSSGQKRGVLSAKGRSRKTTKSEKMHAVTDAIAIAIEGMAGGNAEKYTYLNIRLNFEKEEAAKKRQHEEMMEKRREDAERAREERLLSAERTRENFMMQMLQVALRHGNNNGSEPV
ncbi:hypothetical protein PR003_g27373 [Phytophthora rubi]|uniref:No apical meristem-associated C-terminal domain-containing protein n=2 Tax=Phytophthora rubi TaxID=129364 RepID=A0A6A4C321_9STRA|nr:hypothetical protein PR003_g27373 [Phytophthora rubi]